ncbi:hypothetical protein OG946_20150 [Streptomyces sp. NBC_01808]|uniref:DUF7426 family protein n=1 Tax=Streptomyces sp. NBC_01808 TaxID=2975947 RepID=UPI002DD8B301|nr:hypothetical protein [Streptomyces sp. NBC_01808]WSA39468.1 hypothetical protein OG946_20150 [Streptomyces sp. NBC_01808]
MATAFEALDSLLDDALELPIKGKLYRIPSPSGEDGLKVQRITNLAVQMLAGGESVDTEILDDDLEHDLFRLCLGPVYDELLADGVDWSWIRHAGKTAMMWIVSGVEDAREFWARAGAPSQPAPNRAARRAAKRTGSAAASKTPRRGSTSGTSGRKATASAPKAATT